MVNLKHVHCHQKAKIVEMREKKYNFLPPLISCNLSINWILINRLLKWKKGEKCLNTDYNPFPSLYGYNGENFNQTFPYKAISTIQHTTQNVQVHISCILYIWPLESHQSSSNSLVSAKPIILLLVTQK